MTMIIKKRCKYDSCLNTVTNSAQFITFHVRRRDKIRFFLPTLVVNVNIF